ncbi:MAG: LacI family DNA-binding transcriptional regulator [Proteobacteria bacterium]|nr:LacI family DNA-binding transcriptional regulator [Pseudomonadota bacterium]
MTVPPRTPRASTRPARIADVARLAGVSPATVSRTLANPDIVTTETRQRVIEAVRRTGYVPNIAGRNLRAQRSMMVLVVVPDIANPFFAEVLRGIDDTLSAAGYGLIIGNLNNATAKEARYVDLVSAGQVDGVLLLNGHIPEGNGRNLRDANVPMVAACERIPGADFPQVEIRNREAARRVIAHLVTLGHRRFGYISGPSNNILERERAAGFREGLADAGLPLTSASFFDGDFTFRTGAEAARVVLAMDVRPTAIFAANDEMAIGFLKTVHAAGLRIPADLSIVGFDAIEYADYCEPTLTTVHQPRHTIGATAAAQLVELMSGRARREPRVTRLDASLLLRQSTGPAPAPPQRSNRTRRHRRSPPS